MTTKQPQFTGLANASPHQKLAGYFGVSVEAQRRIGTFIVLFSMIEQTLEMVLMQRSKPRPDGRWPTDQLTVAERFKRIRALARSEPELAKELAIAGEVGELLMEARHTVAHGAPIGNARLERNQSWFGEPRKRPSSALQLGEQALDAAATAAEILYRLLASIGAGLSGQAEVADLMAPRPEEMLALRSAASTIRTAIERPEQD